MSIHDFLDKKHGKFIGRVYLLVALFLFNMLIPVGAIMYFTSGQSPLVLGLGVVGTLICWGVLSTPTKLDQ